MSRARDLADSADKDIAGTLTLDGLDVAGNVTVGGTVDGRDLASDGTKLDGIEANADVTDTTNVTAAGALMDSEVTNLAQVKAFSSADYATAAQGTTADAALPKAGGTMTGALNLGDNVKAQFGASTDLQVYHDSTTGNSYIAESGTGDLVVQGNNMRLQNTSGGYYMRAYNGGAVNLYHNNAEKLATTSTGISVTGNATFADNGKAIFGAGSDLEIYHDGSHSYINDAGTGNLNIKGTDLYLRNAGNEVYIGCLSDGQVYLRYDNVTKLSTTSTGVSVTGTAIASTDTDTTNTGTVTLDFGANQNFVLTLTGNVTLANPTTEQVGQSGFIVFIQDATGGRTVSLGTDYETAGGAGLTLSSAASTTDVVPYIVAASGRILLGTPQLAFA